MELVQTPALTQLPFADAATAWLETRRAYISPKTFHEYELNISTLQKYFGEMQLTQITADQIRAYQRMRQAKCGPFSINHECGVLQQILKRIGRWSDIADQYEPLPLPKRKRGRSLTNDEREKLFKVMASDPNWAAARLCALICINSTASPGEAYKLKLRDVDMQKRRVHIGQQGAKNEKRVRVNPMNAELFDACRQALSRARLLGSHRPEHYLFPFRKHGQEFDPDRHQVTFKTAWDKIIKKAGQYGLNVATLRLEDMRHCALTALYEDPNVSEDTVEELAGHFDPSMKRFYSHLREDTKRKAVESALSPKPPACSGIDEIPTESTENRELARTLLALAAKLLKTG